MTDVSGKAITEGCSKSPSTIDIPLRKVIRFAKWALLLATVYLGQQAYFAPRTAYMVAGGGSQDVGAPLKVSGHAEHLRDKRQLNSEETTTAETASTNSDCETRRLSTSGTTPEPLESMLSIVFFGFLLCLLLDHGNLLLPVHYRLPISCVIFLTGMAVNEIMRQVKEHISEDAGLDDFLWGRLSLSFLDPHAVFFIILPPLLYESASGMSWFVLKRVLASSILLALPGVILNVALTAVLAKGVLQDSAGHAISWEGSFLLASILSATDPVAVVAALRTLGAPQKLSLLIDGEALLNDGSAVVVFLVFQDWAGKSAPDEEKMCPGMSPGCVAGKFVQLAIGGCAAGMISGWIVYLWIKRARFVDSAMLEIAILLTAVYGTFFVSEALNLSGVLGTVVFGIVVTAKISPVMSHEARHAHHTIMSAIGYICDKIIFFAAGMISMRFLRDPVEEGTDCGSIDFGNLVWRLIALYLILHLTRAIVVIACRPLLIRLGYGFTWREGVIMVYGGLRGAVGLSMGLMVEHNEYIPSATAMTIAFNVSGIVLLTLVINGSSVDKLYKKLNPYPSNRHRIQHLSKQLRKLERLCQLKGLRKMQRHWFLRDSDFQAIYHCIPNFGNLSFDDYTGIPAPSGIGDVLSTLQTLELQSKKLEDCSASFEAGWSARHECLSSQVASWLQGALGQDAPAEAKDLSLNILDDGDGVLMYRNLDDESASTDVGYFVSRRSIATIADSVKPQGSIVKRLHASFSAKLDRLGKEDIFVGVCGFLPTDEPKVLGRMPVSAGINCTTGDIIFNRGEGEQVLVRWWEVQRPSPILDQPNYDSKVLMRVAKGDVIEGYIVADWLYLKDGGFIALFPGREGSKESVNGSQRVTIGPPSVEQFEDQNQKIIPRSHCEVTVEVVRSANRPWSIVFSMQCPGDSETKVLGIVSLGQYPPQDMHPVIEFHPATCPAHTSMLDSLLRTGKTLGGKDKNDETISHAPLSNSKVSLSFIPEVVGNTESMNEILNTLFNTVKWEYHRLHDHGIIGDHALTWLTESASEGIDCANCEVHSRRIRSFPRDITRTEELERAVKSVGPVRSASGKLDKTSAQQAKVMLEVMNPFEPLIVSYLAVLTRCRKGTIFDNYPKNWFGSSFVRCLGYGRTRAKVEALYAFVESHQKISTNFSHLSRFPGLVLCLEQVMASAKRDLAALGELNPRRFYYVRHALALQIELSNRLRLLEEQVEEGWLSATDAEGLVEHTRRCLAKVQTHFPLVGGRRRRQDGLGTESQEVFHRSPTSMTLCADAWEETFQVGRVPSDPIERTDSEEEEIADAPRNKIKKATLNYMSSRSDAALPGSIVQPEDHDQWL